MKQINKTNLEARELQITAKVEQLRQNVSLLESRLVELNTRISPILRPEGVSAEKMMEGVKPNFAPLANDISNIGEDVSRLTNFVDEMISLLEI